MASIMMSFDKKIRSILMGTSQEKTNESIALCFQDLNLEMPNFNLTLKAIKKASIQMEKYYTTENQKNQMDLSRFLLKRLRFLQMSNMKIEYQKANKAEKNASSKSKKKVVIEDHSNHKVYEMYNHLNNEGKKYNKNTSAERAESKQNNAINSERPNLNEKLSNDESLDKKRKQSDMIIKKGKQLNLGSGNNSKNLSPIKPQDQETKEDPQSL